MSKEDLAARLFVGVRTKIMPLADDITVYPAHGAGSACGKNMSKETWSTLGLQKRTNYALRADMTKEEFIKEVTDGLLAPPKYFSENAKMNKQGYESIDRVMKRGTKAMSPKEFEAAANATDAIILDVRDKKEVNKAIASLPTEFKQIDILVKISNSYATRPRRGHLRSWGPDG